jgi:outer membrane immunogenic protein
MNTLKSLAAGLSMLAAAGALSSMSAAGDLGKRDSLKDSRPYGSTLSWTGFYLGVHAGGSFGDKSTVTQTDTSTVYATETKTRTHDFDTSALGGVQLGANYQIGGIVLGAEGDFSKSAAEKTDFLASARGRLGYSLGNTLIYGTGGVAFLQWDDAGRWDLSTGWVAGGGFEHKLSPNLSIGLEGLYYAFEDSDTTLGGTPGDKTVYNLDRDLWTARARLNYHFTSGGAPLK